MVELDVETLVGLLTGALLLGWRLRGQWEDWRHPRGPGA